MTTENEMSTKKANAAKAIITLAQVEERLTTIQCQSVLLDSDVAALYAVETREVNQAIQRNPEKFPEGYIISLNKDEWESLKLQRDSDSRSQIVILKKTGQGHNQKYLPKAFTEKGLYMLATILKGECAVRTTIAIVEAFAKIRELGRTVSQLADTGEKFAQQTLMQKSGEIMADIGGCRHDRAHVSRKGFLRYCAPNFRQVLSQIPAGNLGRNGIKKPKRMTCALSRRHPLGRKHENDPFRNQSRTQPCRLEIQAHRQEGDRGMKQFILPTTN